MPRPKRAKLIHPIPVTLEEIDKSNTDYNENANEPVRRASRNTAVNLFAQVTWHREMNPKFRTETVWEEAAGYLLFEIKDLKKNSLVDENGNTGIKRGTKITKIGNDINLKLYVVKVTPMGHYPEPGGSTIIRVYFQDRESR